MRREVWNFATGDWDKLNDLLENTDWSFLDCGTTDTATTQLTETLLNLLGQCVEKKQLKETKSAHPWVNDTTLKLVAAKHAAAGTPHEAAATKACSDGILKEYQEYVRRAWDDIFRLPRGSKVWWQN